MLMLNYGLLHPLIVILAAIIALNSSPGTDIVESPIQLNQCLQLQADYQLLACGHYCTIHCSLVISHTGKHVILDYSLCKHEIRSCYLFFVRR